MESYAALPYDARPITQAHPDRLGVLARMFGLTPTPPERSRILDLGCADGAHLLALAIEYPNSQCVGIDNSVEQIELGRRAAAELGLKNLSLEVAEFGAGIQGEYDYVTAHGVYSWIDAPARELLLATFGRCLAPNGLGYLSYEVYPGAYSRLAVRDLLLPFVRSLGSAAMGARFRALSRAMADALPPDQPGAASLKAELMRASRATDSAVAHDWCSDAHEAVYFRDFAQHLARHELVFVADTTLMRSSASSLTDAGRQVLAELGRAPVERQQAIDILGNAAYRESLVARAGAAPRTEPQYQSELAAAQISTFVTLQGDSGAAGVLRMKNHSGTTANVSDPLIKAALLSLADSAPEALALSDVVTRCEARLGQRLDERARNALAQGLFELFSAGMVDLRRDPARSVARSGDRPRASELCRWQRRRGAKLTNQAHYLVQVPDERAGALIELLDGTRDRARLYVDWASFGTPAELDEYLQRLTKLGLLVA